MSKQHQTSRRRTYGPRQHEMHERTERPVRFLGWVEVNLTGETESQIVPDQYDRPHGGDWILTPGID
ncbi:MAG: hypothetical protein ACHQ01_03880 [Candidatus Limnocylindrales bacterium]